MTDLSPERALARQIWRNRIAEMIADNSKSLMHLEVAVELPTEPEGIQP